VDETSKKYCSLPFFGNCVMAYPLKALKDACDIVGGIVLPSDGMECFDSSIFEKIPYISFSKTEDLFFTALNALKTFLKTRGGHVVFAYGNMPFITSHDILSYVEEHVKKGNVITLFEANKKNQKERVKKEYPQYGKPFLLESVKPGIFVISSKFALDGIERTQTFSGLLNLARNRGLKVDFLPIGNDCLGLSITSGSDFIRSIKILKEYQTEKLILQGVVLEDPTSIFIEPSVLFEEGACIGPNVIIKGNSFIGSGAYVGPFSMIVNSVIMSDVIIKGHSVLEECRIEPSAKIGPFARIRPESMIGKASSVGNFVELKKAELSENVRVNHLSYLGDCEVGAFSNIGAGVITCNYDGVKKYRTVIEDHVFVGSDCQLVAPVHIKSHAYIGAGSTITKDVSKNSLAVSRGKQKEYKDWVEKK